MPKSIFVSETSVCTPLHTAIECGNFAGACKLVESGADVNKKNHNGNTPLYLSLQNEAGLSPDDHLKLVRLLLEHGATVDQENEYGATALHLAVENGRIAVIELLLQHGATVDQQNRYSETALHLAAKSGDAAASELLLKNRATVDQQREYGTTALHRAAWNGHVAVVELLLRHGAKVDQPSKLGNTALYLAAWNSHVKVIELLLRHEAKADQQNERGETALHRAAETGQVRVIELLLGSGAKVDRQNEYGATALHRAAWNGHIEVIELLLRHGAQVDQQTKFGNTALHLAAENGHTAAVKLLLKNGAKVDQQNERGETALQLAVNFAVNNGRFDTVPCLLEGGADIDVVCDANRETALQTAICHRGNSELGELLIHEHMSRNPEIQAIKKLITEVRPNDGDGFTQSWCDGVLQKHERSFATRVEFREGVSEGAPVVLRLAARDLLGWSKPNALMRHGVRPKVARDKLKEIIASDSTKGGSACCLSRLKGLLAEEEERVLETDRALKRFNAYAPPPREDKPLIGIPEEKEDEPLVRIPGRIAEKILSYLSTESIQFFTQALSPSNTSRVYDATELCNPDTGVPSLKP